MKKSLYLMLTLILATLCLTACTGGEKPSEIPQTPDAAQDQPIETETYFGKIKQIVGNEITLDLAKNPNDAFDAAPEAEESGEGAVMPAMSLMAASPAGSAADVPVEEHMELDYLGEEKAFTVPAGTVIFDLTHGQEAQLSALKKGSVLLIKAQSETTVAAEIEIWE